MRLWNISILKNLVLMSMTKRNILHNKHLALNPWYIGKGYKIFPVCRQMHQRANTRCTKMLRMYGIRQSVSRSSRRYQIYRRNCVRLYIDCYIHEDTNPFFLHPANISPILNLPYVSEDFQDFFFFFQKVT